MMSSSVPPVASTPASAPVKNNKSPVSTPTVTWAQRTNTIYLTILVPSVQNANIDIEKQKIHFDGIGGSGASESIPYVINLELFDEIDPEKSSYHIEPLGIMFNLEKHQKDQSYWPRLLTSSVKPHYLKTDFNRWKDEDDNESDNDNVEDAIRGSGMGGGQGPMGGFDFSKMGMDMGGMNMGGMNMGGMNMGGMNMGGMDMGGMDMEPDSDDDLEEDQKELESTQK